MSHPKPRRIKLVDPSFQFRMVAAFLAVQLVVTALFALAIHAFFAGELEANLASAHARVAGLAGLLVPIVATLSVVSFLVSTILITFFVVRLSHRLAGPLFRFRAVLEALGRRELPAHAAIRPDDQFQEVAAALGRTVETLEADLSAWQDAAARAREALAQGDSGAAAEALARLQAGLDGWRRQGRP